MCDLRLLINSSLIFCTEKRLAIYMCEMCEQFNQNMTYTYIQCLFHYKQINSFHLKCNERNIQYTFFSIF